MESLVQLPTDVNYVVGTTATVLTRPDAFSGGIVKTVRGQVGETSSFVAEGAPRHSNSSLLLFADKGSWRFKRGNFAPQDFDDTDVDPDTDSVNIPDHGLLTGQGPFRVLTDTTLPSGLAGATSYWIIVVDEDNFQFAANREDAYNGEAIDLTDDGDGGHTLTGTFNFSFEPSADTEDGSGAIKLSVGQSVKLEPATVYTVKGDASDSVLTYVWAG